MLTDDISAGSSAVLGCGAKRRVGHQLRGRDCENIEGEAGLERRCYCRSEHQGRPLIQTLSFFLSIITVYIIDVKTE